MSFDELFAREWIERAWTLQELVLSPNPVVLCGDKMVEWDDWVDFVVASGDYFDSKPFVGLFLGTFGKRPCISADGLSTWSSAIRLWLTLTRPGSTSNNLDKLVRLDYANRIVRRAKFILGALFWMLLPIWHGGIVVVINLSTKDARLGMLWSFVYLGMLLPLLLFVKICWDVIFGLRPPWFALDRSWQKHKTESGVLHVEGVRVALRERAATLPHDKAFSMVAILKMLGSVDIEIDYQKPLHETFKQLFVAIVKLHPPALQMLCEAGLCPNPDWAGPSWVPNWVAPRPNAGVSSQLCIPFTRRLDDSNFSPEDQYRVDHDSLQISEVAYVGEICSPGFFNERDEGQTWPALQRVCMWYRFIRTNTMLLTLVGPKHTQDLERTRKGQYRDAIVFAALEGLPCPQQQLQAVHVEDSTGLPLFKALKPYEAPLKLHGLKGEFNDFLQFKAILDEYSLADPSLGHDDVRLRQQLDRNDAAARYCHRLMTKLAKNDRAFIAVSGTHQHVSTSGETRGYWAGTAPLRAMPGDQVFQLPKMEGCMILRPTGNDREYQVVGCALLPMVTAKTSMYDITLV